MYEPISNDLWRRASLSGRLQRSYHKATKILHQDFGLHSVEVCYLSGEAESIQLPAGAWDDRFTLLLHELLLQTIPHLVVSPLAAYVAPLALEGASVNEYRATGACLKLQPKRLQTSAKQTQETLRLKRVAPQTPTMRPDPWDGHPVASGFALKPALNCYPYRHLGS